VKKGKFMVEIDMQKNVMLPAEDSLMLNATIVM